MGGNNLDSKGKRLGLNHPQQVGELKKNKMKEKEGWYSCNLNYHNLAWVGQRVYLQE